MATFEYVISAAGQLKIFSSITRDNQFNDDFVKLMHRINDKARNNVREYCKNIDSDISMLFNAYTEKNYGEVLSKSDKFGLRSIYSDSGGLQMVTTNKKITPELKQKVYEIQTQSDYGMCFDTIPLKKITTAQIKSDRAHTKNKLFDQSEFEQSAEITGKDLLNQIKTYKQMDAKTKAILIVQGNTVDDMLLWTDIVMDQIPKDLWYKVEGIAVADTCMGNGQLETIDMMIAAKKIADKYQGENFTKHLHLLGVGCIARLAPTIKLQKSGYLASYDKISYDSSSHTSTVVFGFWKVDKKVGKVAPHKAHSSMSKMLTLYNYYDYSDIMTQDEFLRIVFSNKGDTWCSASSQRAAEKFDDLTYEQKLHALCVTYTYSLYQIENFCKLVEDEYNSKLFQTPIDYLINVKNDADMDSWKRNFMSIVDSNRIARQENHVSLESFFGN